MRIGLQLIAFVFFLNGCSIRSPSSVDTSVSTLAATTNASLAYPKLPPRPIEEQLAQLQNLIEAKEYDRALGVLTPYLEDDAEVTPEILDAIRVLSSMTKNWELAARCAHKSVQLFPDKRLEFGALEINYLILCRQYDPAMKHTKELLAVAKEAPAEQRDGFRQTLLEFAMGAFRQREPVDARMYLTLLKKQPDLLPRLSTAARSLEADFYLHEEKFAEARLIVVELLREDPEAFLLAAMLNKIDASESLAADLRANVNRVSDDWVSWTRVFALKLKDDEFLNLFPQYIAARRRMGLKPAEILYNHYVGVLLDQKMRSQAEAVLREAVADYPDSPNLLNSLAYTYAEANHELSEADRMIRKALESEEDNPAFLDTLGWVLYRQGKYDDALQYLLRAAEEMKDDATILDHAGDTLLAMGKKDEALEFWKQAAAVDPTYEGLQTKIEAQAKK